MKYNKQFFFIMFDFIKCEEISQILDKLVPLRFFVILDSQFLQIHCLPLFPGLQGGSYNPTGWKSEPNRVDLLIQQMLAIWGS